MYNYYPEQDIEFNIDGEWRKGVIAVKSRHNSGWYYIRENGTYSFVHADDIREPADA